MNRVITIAIWTISIFVIGGLITREYGIYTKNEIQKQCKENQPKGYDA
jgi:hypothetical protein